MNKQTFITMYLVILAIAFTIYLVFFEDKEKLPLLACHQPYGTTIVDDYFIDIYTEMIVSSTGETFNPKTCCIYKGE